MAERILWEDWHEHLKRRGRGRVYRMTVDNRQNLDGVLWCLESPDAQGEFCATVRTPDNKFQDREKYYYFTDRTTAFMFKLMFFRPPSA